MDSITVNAPAKINLFLEVCEKRPDSYHNIDSVMQSVSLCDVVTVKKSDVIMLDNNVGLPNNEKNLAYKAASLFFEYTNIKKGAEIYIEKNVPVSAGLAGGSTDAAAVLKALNTIYDTNMSYDTMCELGAKLGADVPFCIKGGTFITRGIGDIFTHCPSLCDCYIVISKSGEGVSTPFAYGEIDNKRLDNKYTFKKSDELVKSLAEGNLYSISNQAFNIFESVVCPLRPKVNEQKKILKDSGAILSMMSGSGPSVFGLFEDKSLAENALNKLKAYGADVHLCKPI